MTAKQKRAREGDPDLEAKMQDYHRKGGAQGGDAAKNLEGDIAMDLLGKNNQLKKGRPES